MDFKVLLERVKNILLTPGAEWPVIVGETRTSREIYLGYVLVLAAIPAVIGFIDAVVFGYSMPFGGTVRVGVGHALSAAITGYVMSFVAVFVMAWVVDMLAPNFGAEKNPLQALKAVAYSYTAAWVAGAGTIVPGLGGLIMLAGVGYSIYLLYLGLQAAMKCPPEKAAGYTAVAVIVGIIVGAIAGAIIGSVIGPQETMPGFSFDPG